MRKTLFATLMASALAAGGAANAALTFDLNGGDAGGVISVTSFDWAPSTFVAVNANAVLNSANPVGQTFDILTHAKLTAYIDGNNVAQSLPAGVGEITLVARFTEVVTGANIIGGLGIATFQTTGAGWLEMYYSSAANSSALTGSGFNDGTLIMKATGIAPGINGLFSRDATTPAVLDQSGGDNYAGQLTVTGTGSQSNVTFGAANFDLDSSFFQTAVADFSLYFQSLSITLPFGSTDPSDCFNPTQNANSIVGGVGPTGNVSSCANVHDNAQQYVGQGADGGLLPVVGTINGAPPAVGGGADFVALTDYSSPVTGTVPEPGSLALLGLALGGLGFFSKRRRA